MKKGIKLLKTLEENLNICKNLNFCKFYKKNETVPNIIFNNPFHGLNIIKNCNKRTGKKIKGD